MNRTMLDWLQRLFPQKPLSGAPAIRRQKNYAAMSGYAYQYFYNGQRALKSGVEYVFDLSAGRTASFPLSIIVRNDAIAAWQKQHERMLESNERYAVAKLALFRALDETDLPRNLPRQVYVDSGQIGELLETLEVD